MKKIAKHITQAIHDTCYIFIEELKTVFRDEGVLIFFILVPIGYPLLYSWLYTNEAMKDVPTVFVDESHSFLSREFTRKCDANENIKVVAVVGSMSEAKEMQAQQKCRGIVNIPSDFEQKIRTGDKTAVTFLADLSGMLFYKGIYAGLTEVSLSMGKEILITRLSGLTINTDRDDELNSAPLRCRPIALFNPQGGYGSFLIPAVLMLVIQQTLLLGIGLSAGTAREKNKFRDLVPIKRHYHGMFRIISGKALCYFTIYAVMIPYITLAVPRMFDFIQIATPHTIFWTMLPFLLSCIFFGMTLSGLVRYRENIILLILFTSVPFLFMSGVSWPGSNIASYWKAISMIIPSTFGINAFVKINSFGATLTEIEYEITAMWIQTLVYFATASVVYWLRINESRKHFLQDRKILMETKASTPQHT